MIDMITNGSSRFPWHRLRWISAVLLILILSGATLSRNAVWRLDETGFWEDAARKSPHKFRPHYNLGVQYDKQGLLQQAEQEFRIAIELNPGDAKPHNNLGWVYVQDDRFDEAAVEFRTATRLNPNHYRAWKNLQAAYERLGRYSDAEKAGRNAEAVSHYAKGMLFAQQGRFGDATRELKTALLLNPDYADAMRELEMITARGHSMTTSPRP